MVLIIRECMTFHAKRFDDLTPREVYEIIKSRNEIFLLEQNIICQDLDDVDYDSLHCFFWEGGRAVAYGRAYAGEKGTVHIGRVLTLAHGKGLGKQLMEKTVDAAKEVFLCEKISLHAQKTAIGFYEKLGFEIVSDEFLEEGVVHVTMEKSC